MLEICKEKPDDKPEVEMLYDITFGPTRYNLPSYQFRQGVKPIDDLSYVVRNNFGTLIGAIRFWPILIGKNKIQTLLLGPIAVHPIVQGEGIGTILMNETITRAKQTDWESIILIGDLPYYGRFEFKRISGVIFPLPTDPQRILCLELKKGAAKKLNGVASSLKNDKGNNPSL